MNLFNLNFSKVFATAVSLWKNWWNMDKWIMKWVQKVPGWIHGVQWYKIHLTRSYVGKYLFFLGPILFNNFINDPEKGENAVLAII